MNERAAWLTLAALALGWGTPITAAPKRSSFNLPPYAGAYEPQGVDERGQWMMADEFERGLRASPGVIQDEALNKFVRDVFCRTVGKDRCATARIYIVREASFNASMFANGMMMVHSGLLFRVRSEAELGSVLGHEFGHFEKRHILHGFRKRRTATDIISWAGFLRNGQQLQNMATLSVYSFSRQQEVEADLVGADYLTASPYPNRAAADVWLRLMDESDATAAGRKLASTRYASGSFFDDHPPPFVRANYLSRVAKALPDDGDAGEDSYAAALAPWMPEFFDEQLKRNDFSGTDFVLTQLAFKGWTSDLLMFRGHLYRQRGAPRDLVSATQFYQQAIDAGSAQPDCWRGLGLAALRLGEKSAGKAALSEYLKRAPNAVDRATIAALIEQTS